MSMKTLIDLERIWMKRSKITNKNLITYYFFDKLLEKYSESSVMSLITSIYSGLKS